MSMAFPTSYLQTTEGCLERDLWEQWLLPCLAERMWAPDNVGSPFMAIFDNPTYDGVLDVLLRAFRSEDYVTEAARQYRARPMFHGFWWDVWVWLANTVFASVEGPEAVAVEVFDDSGLGPLESNFPQQPRIVLGGLPFISEVPSYRLPCHRGTSLRPPSLGGVLAKRWPQSGDVFGPWVVADVLRCLHQIPGYYAYVGYSVPQSGPYAGILSLHPTLGAWGISNRCTVTLYGSMDGNQTGPFTVVHESIQESPMPWIIDQVPALWVAFAIIHDVQWTHDLSNIPVIG